jgi:hypothetical protein
MDCMPHVLHGSHISLSSGCVLAMHNMKQLDLCDTWGPARVQCSVDLQVLDIRFVRPEPHTGVSDLRCLMLLSDGLHSMRGMLHDSLSVMASEGSVCRALCPTCVCCALCALCYPACVVDRFALDAQICKLQILRLHSWRPYDTQGKRLLIIHDMTPLLNPPSVQLGNPQPVVTTTTTSTSCSEVSEAEIDHVLACQALEMLEKYDD